MRLQSTYPNFYCNQVLQLAILPNLMIYKIFHQQFLLHTHRYMNWNLPRFLVLEELMVREGDKLHLPNNNLF